MKRYQKPEVIVENFEFENIMGTAESDGYLDEPEANSIQFDENDVSSVPEQISTNLWDD